MIECMPTWNVRIDSLAGRSIDLWHGRTSLTSCIEILRANTEVSILHYRATQQPNNPPLPFCSPPWTACLELRTPWLLIDGVVCSVCANRRR